MNADRFDINEVSPNIYKPLLDLNENLKNSSLSPSEIMLIYIRASQINGCSYCIQSHINEAVENGEKQYRIHALSHWQETPFFTKNEQIILEMTEEITIISSQGLSDKLYEKGLEYLGKEKIADIIMAICCINAWNRIGRSTLLVPIPSQN